MKDKILLFIIGLLVGAIIATGAFYVYNKSTSTCTTNSNTQMSLPGGNPPSMSDNQNGEPPAKPGESNTGMSTNTQNSQSNN